jgi:hypothetical protein
MKNFIKTEGYPKWMYIYPSCREEDKRIVLCEITKAEFPFIFVKKCDEVRFFYEVEFNIDATKFVKDVPNAEPVFPVNKNRTIEDGLEVNDIIIDNDNDEKKVLAVLNEENRVYLLSVLNEFDVAGDVYTLSEIINDCHKLKSQVDSDTVEMTVEEISKQLGKNVKIVKG